MSFFQEKNYTQSLVATVDCLVAEISYSDLNALESSDIEMLLQVMRRLGLHITKRLRKTNYLLSSRIRKILINSYKKVFYESFFITWLVFIVFCYIVDNYVEFLYSISNTFKFFVSMVQIFLLPFLIFFFKNRPSYASFGLTLKGWRTSMFYSLIVTLCLCLLAVLFKFLCIKAGLFSKARGLFEFRVKSTSDFLIIFVYCASCFPQEFITRGVFQTSLDEILQAESPWISILISNFIFMSLHISSFGYMLSSLVFLTGCCWGWVYSKQKTLVGVVFSHCFLGIFCLRILGFL